MALLWVAAASSADPALLHHLLTHYPEHIAPHTVGYAGRVAPSWEQDTGWVDPSKYGHIHPDDYDHHHEAYEPHDYTPELHAFVRRHGGNTKLFNNPRHVDLSQPIYATQPHITRTHLARYLANPDDKTQFEHHNDEMLAQHPDKKDPKHLEGRVRQLAAEDYPFTHHPGFVAYRNRLHTIDGHHRVAAALMRGDDHIKGYVYDADKHGFPPWTPSRPSAYESMLPSNFQTGQSR